MSYALEVSAGSKAVSSTPPLEFLKQTNSTNTAPRKEMLTLKQQLKQDAMDLAELIYDIYNGNCPIPSLGESQKGKSDV